MLSKACNKRTYRDGPAGFGILTFPLLLAAMVALAGCGKKTTTCCTKKASKAPFAKALPDHQAHPAAPPVITHPVAALGRQNCLSCHLHGDAISLDGQRTKKTPHPELEYCTQCHLEKKTDGLRVKSNFRGRGYVMGLRSHSKGPWLIPHPLTMRENCLGCHHNRAEPKRLRTTHPGRQRCLQCHIPAHQGFPGPRPGLVPPEVRGGGVSEWSL